MCPDSNMTPLMRRWVLSWDGTQIFMNSKAGGCFSLKNNAVRSAMKYIGKKGKGNLVLEFDGSLQELIYACAR